MDMELQGVNMNPQQLKAEQTKLQAMLMIKASIEHNSSIQTLLLQVINANSNSKSLKDNRLIKAIKDINKAYTQKLDEISRAIESDDSGKVV